jgi:hypothetical protein
MFDRRKRRETISRHGKCDTLLAALPLRSVVRAMPSQSFTEVARVEVTNLGSKK